MQVKTGCSCYTTDIEPGKSFVYRGDVYVVIKHGEDCCQVRRVACTTPYGVEFRNGDVENFNSYADVKPFTIEG